VLAQLAKFEVDAHPGKGVVIQGFLSGKLNSPLWYLRTKLSEDSPLWKKVRIHLDDMTEARAERLGLAKQRDGGYAFTS
jgi:hypothetical protein